MICGWFYRTLMRVAHKYNWHYAPTIYPNGDKQLWCKWCGFRMTIKMPKGDGITDDTEAIQALMDLQAECGTCIPIGTFRITGKIIEDNKCK